MNSKEQKLAPDAVRLAAAKETYLRLKQEVSSWQEERGPVWIGTILQAAAPPYYSLPDLPEEAVLELWQRLNLAGDGIEVSPETLRQLWREFRQGGSIPETTLLSRLYLALSGIVQVARDSLAPDFGQEDQSAGTCPVCGEEGGMALLVPPVGRRYLHCGICGHERPVRATGCVLCGSEDPRHQTYLETPEYPGVAVAVCRDCGGHFKEFDLRRLVVEDIMWEDIRTLPLNYAADKWLAEEKKERMV